MKFSTVSLLGLLTIAATTASEIDDIESSTMLRKKTPKKPKKAETCSRSCTIKPLDADMLITKVSLTERNDAKCIKYIHVLVEFCSSNILILQCLLSLFH